jgi:hypothetical protein
MFRQFRATSRVLHIRSSLVKERDRPPNVWSNILSLTVSQGCPSDGPSTFVQPVKAILHILKRHIGIHIRRYSRRSMTELLLDLSKIAGFF